MHQFLLSVVSIGFVLGVLVFVHEFGHFAVAKMCKVRVEVFSLGFGKRLFGFRKGETDYRVSAIPLGGYVKMAGENVMEEHTGAPDEFSSHPRWQRFLIAIAGPAMNILLAIAVLTGLFMWHSERELYITSTPVIGYIAKDTPAANAGLQIGDRILRIDNDTTNTWHDVQAQLQLNAGQTVHAAIDRAGQTKTLDLNVPNFDEETAPEQAIGVYPAEPLIVRTVVPSTPADKAGLQKGDQIVGLDNTAPRSMIAVIEYLQQGKGAPIQLTIKRNNQTKTLSLTPALNDDGKYRIGFDGGWVQEEQLPFSKALARSVKENEQTSLLIVKFLGKMVQRPAQVRKMSSVVMMAKFSGEAAHEGWVSLLAFMAGISVNLGIFNLLPIPILDGGVILLLFIEGLMRRELNRQLKERIYQAAFVFLLIFAVLVIFNDIVKLSFPHKM